MIRPTRAWRTAMVLATASLVLTACGSDTEDPETTEEPAAEETSEAPTQGDGVLTVGTLLPQTGDLAFLGPPEFAGVQLAVDEINAAGGVLGEEVVQQKADSGDGTPDIAGASVDRLLEANADVIVGAAASGVSLSVINKITDAGVVEFSPANTSPSFDDPETDPNNLYFRTAPSDVLQGAVLSNLIVEDGNTDVAILARQDSYGELLATETEKGLEAGGANIVSKQLYAADATNYTAEVNEIASQNPDAIALIAFNETTKIIPQLIGQGIGPKDVQIYFVDGNLADYSKDFPKGTLAGVKGTLPGAELTGDFRELLLETDPSLTEFAYAPESYDAVTMTALAAVAAGTDDPETFAPEIINISRDGTECSGFQECADLLDQGEDIDYTGVSGPCDLGDTGSPTKASIGIYEYKADNTFKNIDYIAGVI